MKAMVVYGCPCAGKSTYVINHAGDNDVIYDYDAILLASTTRKKHLVDRHAAHFVILNLRKSIVDNAKTERAIDRIWLLCRWPTDTIKEILDGVDSEEIFIEATKEECYARLEADDTRPDKDQWRALIDEWFNTYGKHDKDQSNTDNDNNDNNNSNKDNNDSNNNLKGTQQVRKEDYMTNNKFWNFVKNEAGERTLRLEGPIDSDNLWGDAVTPQMFRDELEAEDGDITVWINSPGGSVFAAAEIYTMLCDYSSKRGKVTVKVDAIAASAASVVAMAGERVLMSPVAMLMIHDPMTIAMGNVSDMEKVITTLNEIKESIINAYQKKTGLSRNKISKLMSDETWLNAKKAVELGFADEILFSTDANQSDDAEKSTDNSPDKVNGSEDTGISIEGGGEKSAANTRNSQNVQPTSALWTSEWQPYSSRAMGQAILNRLLPANNDESVPDEESVAESAETGNGEAVLESDLNAPAEEAPQAVQTQEEEAPLATTTVSDEAPVQSETPDESTTPDETQSNVVNAVQDEENDENDEDKENNSGATTGNEQEPGAEAPKPVEESNTEPDGITVVTTDSSVPPAISDDEVIEPVEPDNNPIIGLDGKAKDGSMPYTLLEKQLELLR